MNGRFEVPVTALEGVTWRKSRHSGKWGNCVELAALDDGTIALRQSREPQGTALICTRDELAAFLRGAKDGEFDDLVR
ncbi:DUF397 domain-containing protein [Saccharopolyspora hordei]|uniref:DUF397 domain-containing protein n=1 Tax=Saccharopolyspora hordei TaxID=1838 RepID=A0A853AN26_9PSEU|nr:DUF397 domain-containing protein [Saccharopolyspora hordei]NYI85528.1 hypothetical protein [Saccharopolyspora hordei]